MGRFAGLAERPYLCCHRRKERGSPDTREAGEGVRWSMSVRAKRAVSLWVLVAVLLMVAPMSALAGAEQSTAIPPKGELRMVTVESFHEDFEALQANAKAVDFEGAVLLPPVYSDGRWVHVFFNAGELSVHLESTSQAQDGEIIGMRVISRAGDGNAFREACAMAIEAIHLAGEAVRMDELVRLLYAMEPMETVIAAANEAENSAYTLSYEVINRHEVLAFKTNAPYDVEGGFVIPLDEDVYFPFLDKGLTVKAFEANLLRLIEEFRIQLYLDKENSFTMPLESGGYAHAYVLSNVVIVLRTHEESQDSPVYTIQLIDAGDDVEVFYAAALYTFGAAAGLGDYEMVALGAITGEKTTYGEMCELLPLAALNGKMLLLDVSPDGELRGYIMGTPEGSPI